MAEGRLPSGENTSPPQLLNMIQEIGPSSTSDQIKFDKIALEWAKKPGNFVNEVATAIIYMINETSRQNIEPKKKDSRVNFDFSAVLRARWNELSDIKGDQNLLIQNKNSKIETGWNSSIFVEGIQKLVKPSCQNIDNAEIFWDKVIKYVINNSNQLYLSGNDGSFEFFCSILGEIYRRGENKTYIPKDDELFCKIDPFLQKWENPTVQAQFIVKICRLGFEVQNGGYNIHQRNDINFLDESLLNDDLKFDQLYPSINNYSVILDANHLVPESLLSMIKSDKRVAELIENGLIGTPIIYNELKLPRIAVIHSKGSCGAFICSRLLKVLFDLSSRVKDQKLLDQIHHLLFFDIPRYSPIGMLSSLGMIYCDLPNYLKLSNDLVGKVSELFETGIKSNELDKTILINISISSIQEFICSPRSKMIANSQEKEYELGPNFGLLMQILFASFDEHSSRRSRNLQFIRDLIGQITLRYRFSSIVILSRLTSLGRKYIWKFLKNEYTVLPRLCDMVEVKGQVPPIFHRENRRVTKSNPNIHIDYFHWWFLCLDLIVAGISIRQNSGLNLTEGECNEIIQDSTEVLSRLFQKELEGRDSESFLLIVAIVDYIRARLVYMTYASAELQTILVNRRISLPSFSFEKAVNFKIFAARIVRRNLLLGSPKLSFPSNFWASSFGTPSFSYYYWCISSFVILAIKNAIIEFKLSIDGLENIQVFNLLEALTEFEMIKVDRGINSGIVNFRDDSVRSNSGTISSISIKESDASKVEKTPSDKSLTGLKDTNNCNNGIDIVPIEGSRVAHDLEINDKVNEYFTRFYTGKMSVKELISELKRVNSRDSTGDCKLFNIFLQTLFDECRSFPKYPIPELRLTAIMLGTLVKEDMLIPCGNALVFVQRCIIEALRKNHWSKMFCFGVLAMEQFIDKLINFPQFLFAILIMSKHLEPAIGSYIRYCEYCLSLLPDSLRNRLFIEKDVLKSFGISPSMAPKNLVSMCSPEMISFCCHTENITKGDAHCHISKNRLGSLIKLDISSKRTLPDGLTIEQLQGFGLGSLEKLMNDPRIYDTITIPSDNVIEQIFAICNTLASTNVDSKAQEMAEILGKNPEYSYWFAFYLVKNRASKEKNNHSTYVSLLVKLDELLPDITDSFHDSKLNDTSAVPITRKGSNFDVGRSITDIAALASYDCIKALLCYSTILNEVSSFVNILRHLGCWLGQITIGINHPIIHKYLNPRQLLIESYSKGCISSTLPFVCKILESAKNTHFVPPNPWTNSLLLTLAEIHSTANNANSRMFEVELLFKQLELNLEDYSDKSNYLMVGPQVFNSYNVNTLNEEQRRIYMNVRTHQGANTQYSGVLHNRNTSNLNNFSKTVPTSFTQPSNLNDSQLISSFMPPHYNQMMVQQQSRQYQIPTMDMQFWANKVLISPSIPLFQIQPSLRPLVPLALDRSIKEILQVVIPRSVRIAIITTREIVGKDFAFEPDENIYRRATQLMVSSLSGSMAIAACREPLRVAFIAQLRQILHQTLSREEDHLLVEQIAQVLCSDNIDLGCYIIEQAVIKRAVEELEDSISPGILYRKKMRESGQQFVDINYYGGPNSQIQTLYLSSLPEILKYRQNSMRHLQLYRDFLLFTLMRNVYKDSSSQPEARVSNTGQQITQVSRQQGRGDQIAGQIHRSQCSHQNTNRYSNRQDLPQNTTSNKVEMNYRLSSNNHIHTKSTNTLIVQPQEPVRVPLLFEISLFPLMSRVDECLSQIKDVIREMALYPPIFPRNFFPPVGNLSYESHYRSQVFTFSRPLGSKVTISSPRTTAHPVLSVLASLPSDHILFYLCKVVCTIAASASQKEDILIGISQKLFRTLFDAAAAYQQSIMGAIPSTKCIASALGFDAALLHIEVFLGLSHQLLLVNPKFCSKLRKEAVGWFVHAIEEPKYSVDIIVGALRYGLVSNHEFDISLTNLLDKEFPLKKSDDSSGSLGKFLNFIEFTYKLFFRCIGDWHFPIDKRLPKTTQVLKSLTNNTLLIQNHFSTRSVILPGFYYKPNPSKTNLAEIKSMVDSLLREIGSKKITSTHLDWIGEKVPDIVNFCTITKSYTDKVINPLYPGLPVPMTPSGEVTSVVGRIFDEWILLLRMTIFSGVGTNERNNPYRNLFLQRLARQGLLKMDDRTEKLFTACIERAIYLSLNKKFTGLSLRKNINAKSCDISNTQADMDPFPLDSLVKLITTMARFLDPQQMISVVTTHKFLSILTKIIHKSSESSTFNQRPYYRIFFALLCEYESIGQSSEMVHFTCILSIVNHLHYINPNRVPAFAYSWIQIISSNKLFPYLLRHAKSWQPYQSLLIQLFTFISPYLKYIQLSDNIKSIYGALLRILLVLLHDFPEFLCDYSYSFCDALPLNCIQIRNLILSAFPRNMKLPDPFLPTLRIENIPEIKVIPRMTSNYGPYILYKELKANIDRYWVTRDYSILPLIMKAMKLNRENAIKKGTKYFFPVITALLLYVGIYLPNGSRSNSNIDNSSEAVSVSVPDLEPINLKVDNLDEKGDLKNVIDSIEDPSLAIFLFLSKNLDMEGRFNFISAITNFLGYPNYYTFYFRTLLLWLFLNSYDSVVQEQITRILLERLIVHRPHPWGLLITFIELIKDPKYSFWSCSFVHLAPEVEKLFQSVAQTCLGQGLNKNSSVNS
ncbi:transcription regulatory [Cryptosporidium xiaoi]|uniref:Transcription regulatory n=1 Tax=Cryptosporidium xiaoi TaxID=659607 RepID=A0AAV9Y077_9CRYT